MKGAQAAIPEELKLWHKYGAFLDGHFSLSSGLHSNSYFQAALILRYPWIALELGKQLARRFSDLKVDTVLGPALGGIIIAHEVARALRRPAVFAERPEGEFTLRRGFHLRKGETVVIVEDVVTTGKSFIEVARLVEANGAHVVGVGSLVYRGKDAAEFPYRFESLVKFMPETWQPDECPLCRKGIPINKPGSRKSV